MNLRKNKKTPTPRKNLTFKFKKLEKHNFPLHLRAKPQTRTFENRPSLNPQFFRNTSATPTNTKKTFCEHIFRKSNEGMYKVFALAETHHVPEELRSISSPLIYFI